jgi:ribosomal protein S18 acetylase RimI-like enzyme
MYDKGAGVSFVESQVMVRFFKPRDVKEVHRVMKESSPTPWSEEGFLTFSSAPSAKILVAEREGEILAFAAVRVEWGLSGMRPVKRGYIAELAVAKKHRRRGIGTSLMKRVLSYFKDKGAREARLHVREGNLVARKFYSSLGFKADKLEKNYYSDGAGVRMSLSLS